MPEAKIPTAKIPTAKIPIGTVLLDMDGVLTDFVGAAITAHGKRPEAVLAQWPPNTHWLHEVLKVDLTEFWRPLNAQGESFWRNLPSYRWTPAMLEWVETVPPNWAICTSPSRHPASARGKVEWLYANVRPAFREVALTPRKHLLANPRAVLIDDTERMVERFEAAGGHAVLFPQTWNRKGAMADPWAHVLEELTTRFCFETAE